MELIVSIITTITLLLLTGLVLLINSYVLAKVNTRKTLILASQAAIHSLTFNDEYTAGDKDKIIADTLRNMNFQIASNEEPFEIADVTEINEDNVITFTILKPYKWLNIRKYIEEKSSIDLDNIGLCSEYSKDVEEVIEEIKTITFIVDHKVYSQSNLMVGETIELPTTPLKPKYNFVGWYIKDDLDKDIISEEEWANLRIADNMTFIAQFKAKY